MASTSGRGGAPDLLPGTKDEFRSKEYWDDFFKKRKEESFEWYGSFSDIDALFSARFPLTSRILVVGCGNSESSAEMYDQGYHNIVNVDFSDVVIAEMKKKNIQRPKMEWKVMDILDLAYDDGSFDVVFDKGLLDAMFPSDAKDVLDDIKKMRSEISRVLTPKGSYVCITLAQEHILDDVLKAYVGQWDVRVAEFVPEDSAGTLNPFFVTCTKDEAPSSQVFLSLLTGPSKAEGSRKESKLSAEECKKQVHDIHVYAIAQHGLKDFKIGNQTSLEVWRDVKDDCPRFTLSVIDYKMHGPAGSCGVFIVPQGREGEWMFNTEEGRLQLATSLGYSRLVVVSLNPGHEFESMEKIQEELSSSMSGLSPPQMTAKEKIPFLTVGEGIGHREVVHRASSAFSGPLIVEDVTTEDGCMRRLIFLDNKNVVQSEVRLKPQDAQPSTGEAPPPAPEPEITPNDQSGEKKKKKKKKKKKPQAQIDPTYLAFDYHAAMVSGLSLIDTLLVDRNAQLSCLLVGLGGGSLALFLRDNIPRLAIQVVELDQAIVDVATNYFGFKQSNRIKCHVGDGIDYVKSQAEAVQDGSEGSFDIVIIDVDSKDVTVGMSCPPESFVTQDYLAAVNKVLTKNGVAVFNIACRNRALYQDVLERLHGSFAQVFHLKPSDEDINVVMFAFKNPIEAVGVIAERGAKLKKQYHLGEVDVAELVERLHLSDPAKLSGGKADNKGKGKTQSKNQKKKKKK